MFRWAFVVLALITIVPIWSVHHLPTSDGPCHLYNAWIVRDLAGGHAGKAIESYYRIDLRPHPNWLGHAFMAVAMTVVPPLIAEKLLFTAIVLSFLWGVWILTGAVDPRCHAYAFIAFPFAYHQLVQWGFYNFALSVSLFLITIAVWWRWRDEPGTGRIALIAALLVLVYFSHPVGAALAIGSIVLLWLAALPRRRFSVHSRHLLALLPALALLGWFAMSRGLGGAPEEKSPSDLLDSLVHGHILFTFDFRQVRLGSLTVLCIALLLVATAIRERFPVRRREADIFLLLLLAFVILYIGAPAGLSGGALVNLRLTLFILTIALPWLSPELPAWVRNGVVVLFSLVALGNVVFLVRHYRSADRIITRYLAPLRNVSPGTTVLPLNFERYRPGELVGFLAHAADYAAIERRFVDLGNYEPGTGYFPTTHAPDVPQADIGVIEGTPEKVDIARHVPFTDYVFTWKLPRPSDAAARIDRAYQLVQSNGDAALYARKPPLRTFREEAMLLLPLAGTSGEIRTARGSRWKIDQELRNTSDHVLPVIVTIGDDSREINLAPHQAVPIASDTQQSPFTIVRAERQDIEYIEASTSVSGIPIATVKEPDLHASPMILKSVPLSSRARLNLRLWAFRTPLPVRYVAAIVSRGGELASRSFATRADGFQIDSNFLSEFPQLAPIERRADVVITLPDAGPNARMWAFITATDNETGAVTMYYPR